MSIISSDGYFLGSAYRPQTKFAKVMFSQVSVHGGGGCLPPAQCMLACGQHAGGTHPTGMHSCVNKILCRNDPRKGGYSKAVVKLSEAPSYSNVPG